MLSQSPTAAWKIIQTLNYPVQKLDSQRLLIYLSLMKILNYFILPSSSNLAYPSWCLCTKCHTFILKRKCKNYYRYNRINFWFIKFLTISVTYIVKFLNLTISKRPACQSKRTENFENRQTSLALLAVILPSDIIL